jgi:3-hydroxyisobutyrate dehydrogenase-like beta-hydroxyacid dehydrogenase
VHGRVIARTLCKKIGAPGANAGATKGRLALQETLGMIGLGAMGLPVAKRLAAAGYPVVAYDRALERLSSLEGQKGVELAERPEAVVERADILLTCLPTPAIVEEVYEGVSKPGLLAMDLSTVGPSLAQRLWRGLKERGVAYVESPMLGGVDEAVQGTLFLVVSGEPGNVKRVEHLFPLISRDQRRVGGPGNASRFKTVQNGLGLVQMAAIAEALAMLEAAGADLPAFIDVVNEGRGMAATPLFRAKAPLMLDPAAPVKGELHIGAKDSALARDLARELGLTLPLFERSAELFAAAMQSGLAKADIAAVARVMDAEIGRQIGQRGEP